MAVSHKKFKTEVQQLLDLVIHSLYSNREIFLRELISNASDAIDRARFEALSHKEMLEDDAEWRIQVTADKGARTLTIRDNGIGMSREEVEANVGTIASSGTRRFLEEARKAGGTLPPELIGQFGVGFYSAFMVADKVTLVTRRHGDPAAGVRWVSAGDGAYDIETLTCERRGTCVTLHLKPDADEFLDEWKLRKIVARYSDFVEHPVYLDVPGSPESKDTAAKAPEPVNRRKAIWQRAKTDITPDEYAEFYRHLTHDVQAPLETIHWTGEGTTEFRALLYIPPHAGWDFFMPDLQQRGLHLYVKRVFITDNCEELRPPYLRFLRGVIDSSDLPLNVSRELLQENRLVRVIRTNLVKKVLDTLAEMKAKSRETYLTFWREFGRVLKEGLHLDVPNREKLQELLLFASAAGAPDALVSLQEYVEKMPASQKAIYYLVGDSRQALENSPHLEAFRKAGFDVLFMTDPIDEWVVQSVVTFQDKPLKCITRGDADLPPADAAADAAAPDAARPQDLQPLLGYLKAQLGERVRDVTASRRLTESACCLVFDEHAPGLHTERILKAMGRDVPASKGTLELNPEHAVVQAMRRLLERDAQHPKLVEYAELLLDQALLTAGLPVADLLRFTRRVSSLMAAEGQALTPPAATGP